MSMITTNKSQIWQLRQTPVESQPGRCHARFTPSILNQASMAVDEIECTTRQSKAMSREAPSDGDGSYALRKTISLLKLRRVYAFGRLMFYLVGAAGISIIFLPVLAMIWLANAITASEARDFDSCTLDATSLANSGERD